jgi:malonate transporter and related proteins
MIIAIQNPLVWAPMLGIVISLLGIPLPAIADLSLKLIGQPTPGVSLLCLGLIMSSHKPRLTPEIWSNVF